MEETTGALSVLYNAGYDGSMAGTTLRQALSSLMNPSGEAQKVIEGLGISMGQLDPTTNSLADIVDILAKSGMTTADAMKVFGDRAGPGMMALLAQGSDALLDMEKAITGTNSASDMANKQTDTLQGQIKLLTSQLEEIALQFGDVLIPIIRQLLNKYITPMIAKFAGLSSGTKKNIVTIALLVAAIGPLFLVIGKLISSVGLIIKVGSLLFSKVGLIIAIIAAVVLVVKRLWDTNEEFRNAVKNIWEKIKGFILNAVNAVKDWWDKNGEKVVKRVVFALKKVWSVVKTVFGKIKQIALVVWPIVKDIVIDTVNAIKTFWEENGAKIWATVSSLFTGIWQIVKTAFNIIVDAVMKLLTYVR
ncbi:MAG: phage tail tape measure protein, partial [Clostridia bacterium]